MQKSLSEVGQSTPEFKTYIEHNAYMEKKYELSKLTQGRKKEIAISVAELAKKKGIPLFPKSHYRNIEAEKNNINRKKPA